MKLGFIKFPFCAIMEKDRIGEKLKYLKIMTREEFIRKRKHLFWYIKNPEKVSDESLVEHILNYGDWDDVQKLFALIGIKKAARIFKKETSRPRINYGRYTLNYFRLYFQRHAH